MARASFRPGDPSQQAAPKSASRASFRPGDPKQQAAPAAPKAANAAAGQDSQKRSSTVGGDKLTLTKELAPELQRAIAAELQVGLECIQNTVQVEILEVVEELQTQVQNLSKRFDKWKDDRSDGSGDKDGKGGKGGGEATALKVEMHNFKDLVKSIQDDVSKMQKSLEASQEDSKRVEGTVRKLEYIGERQKAARTEGAGASPAPGSPGGKPLQGRIINAMQTDLKREMERAKKMEDRILFLEDKLEVAGPKKSASSAPAEEVKGGDAKKDASADKSANFSKAVSGFAQAGPRAAKKEEEERADKVDNELQNVKKAITGLRKDLKTETEERIAKDEELSKMIGEPKGGGDKVAEKTAKKLNIQG